MLPGVSKNGAGCNQPTMKPKSHRGMPVKFLKTEVVISPALSPHQREYVAVKALAPTRAKPRSSGAKNKNKSASSRGLFRPRLHPLRHLLHHAGHISHHLRHIFHFFRRHFAALHHLLHHATFHHPSLHLHPLFHWHCLFFLSQGRGGTQSHP